MYKTDWHVFCLFLRQCVYLFSRGLLGLWITQNEKALFHLKIPSLDEDEFECTQLYFCFFMNTYFYLKKIGN